MEVHLDPSFKDMLFSARSQKYEVEFKNKLKYFFKEDMNINFYRFYNQVFDGENLIYKYIPNNIEIIFGAYFDNTFAHGFENDLSKLQVGAEGYPLICPVLDNEPYPQDVYCKDGLALATYDKNHQIIYFLFNTDYEGVARTRRMLNLILEVIDYFSKKYSGNEIFLESQEQILTPQNLPEYNKTIKGSFLKILNAKEIKRLTSILSDCNSRVDEYSRYLKEYNLKANQTRTKIDAINNICYNDININNVFVKNIEFENSEIIVYTNDIFVTDFNINIYNSLVSEQYNSAYATAKKIEEITPKFYIGRFKIVINLSDMTIRFINLNNCRKSYWSDNDNHPHVKYTGEGCLGDLAEIIAFATSNNDIELLINSCIQYLQSANLDDPAGKRIINWDLVYEKDGSLYYYNTDEKYYLLEKPSCLQDNLNDILF